MREVEIDALPLERFATLLAPERLRALQEGAAAARVLLAGRTVWNLNATAQGGGVAEMLQTLLAYGRGAGVVTRWLVLRGTSEFFALTKRIHNLLHGSAGDGGPLGPAEQELFRRVTADNLAGLSRAPGAQLSSAPGKRSRTRRRCLARSRVRSWRETPARSAARDTTPPAATSTASR